MDKVSIVTVNYNQTKITIELLLSLQRQGYSNLEIIVVDNGSRVNPGNIITTQFSKVKFIRTDKNLGFAGGNNLGLKSATGDYVFFINNDTEIPWGTIKTLVSTLKRNPNIGVVCPIINYYDQPDITQYAGYTSINTLTGRNKAIGHGQYVKFENKIELTHYAHGAAMMVKRKVIDSVGGMPENYFLYYEELDWGSKIRQRGYEIAVVKNAYILHKESVSTGKSSPLKTYFQTRNRILFMRRNFGIFRRSAFCIFFFLFSIPKGILKYSVRGHFDHLLSFINGIFWNLREPVDSLRIGYKYDFLNK